MKFSTFLEANEEDRTFRKDLTEGKFLELLNTRCKNSHIIAKSIPFFRKDKGSELSLITPQHREERSSFWVDKFIQEIPGWKKFPSRTTCIKGHTTLDMSDDVFVIIPFDGARIGVTSNASFYRSFNRMIDLGFDRIDNKSFIDWINILQQSISEITGEKIDTVEPKTYNQFLKTLSKIDELIKNKFDLKKKLSSSDGLSLEHSKILKDLLDRHVTTIEQYLKEKLNPEDNGFSCGKIESFSRSRGEYEIWIDSPCLLIKRSKYIELHKQEAL